MIEKSESYSGGTGFPWRIAAWGAAGLILVTPLVAMQFTEEVNWSVGDFAIAGALLVGVGVAFELALRKSGDIAYRAAIAVALAAAFLLVWVNGAVGIIGSENNDANLMFFGVLAVGIIGAIIARLKSPGMARALVATAFAQVLAALVALIAGLGSAGPAWPRDILLITGFFTALWVGSALLFRKAAQVQAHGDPGKAAVISGSAAALRAAENHQSSE